MRACRSIRRSSPATRREEGPFAGSLGKKCGGCAAWSLVWSGDEQRKPKPDEIELTFFDAEAKGCIPTWWNKAVLRRADRPDVSADGRTYAYAIPADTFGLVVSLAGGRTAADYDVPAIHAFGPDRWKSMDVEIEWGFDQATAGLDFGGRIEPYDGIVDNLRPLDGDGGTRVVGPDHWRSTAVPGARRGVRLGLLYLGASKGRKVWPYNAAEEDVARTIVTLWTRSGNFSFLPSDLEKGPILRAGMRLLRACGPHFTAGAALRR